MLTTENGADVNAPFGAIPMHVDMLGASGSEAMFMPLSPSEGLGISCLANTATAATAWFAIVGGYYVPSP